MQELLILVRLTEKQQIKIPAAIQRAVTRHKSVNDSYLYLNNSPSVLSDPTNS